MIDLPREQLHLVTAILQEHLPGCRIRAFGSRVTGRATRFSDLDLLIEAGNPSPAQLEAARDALAESDLPILVDLVLAEELPEPLRQTITEHAQSIS